MTLKDFSNIPFCLSYLGTVFPNNKALAVKAKRLEDADKIIRLKRGMYVTNPKISEARLNEFLIANHLHGPSYVSMQTALRYYGIIPESVNETISVTTGTTKTFTNKIGEFRYIHSCDDYFSIGIVSASEGNTMFLIASPEKALCDLMVFTPKLNLRYTKEVRHYLEEDLRISTEDIMNFDLTILRRCADVGKKKTMITQLIKIIENERNI